MGSIYRRKDSNVFWLAFKDASGKRHLVSSNSSDEKTAMAMLEQLEARARTPATQPLAVKPHTVRTFLEAWGERRKREGLSDTVHELQRVRLHAGPLLDMPITEVKPRHVRDLLTTMKARIGPLKTDLAPRSVNKLFGTLHTMFEHCISDELIESNPVNLRRGELPRKVDKNPLWRQGAVYSRDEAERLISDPGIPEYRRTYYALGLLTGMRLGEISALRWEAIDLDAKPLGRITIARSYDRKNKREKSTKTGHVRDAPIHPTLAAILAAWKVGGFARFVGKPPEPGDLVVPNTRGKVTKDISVRANLLADLDLLGIRHRRFHDTRRTFISLALSDGARKDVLRWVTHSGATDIMDLYTTIPWASKCDEVRKLRVGLRDPASEAKVVPLVVGDSSRGPYPAPSAQPVRVKMLRFALRSGLASPNHPHFFTNSHGQGGTRRSSDEGQAAPASEIAGTSADETRNEVQPGVDERSNVATLGSVTDHIERAIDALRAGEAPRNVRRELLAALAALDEVPE